MTSSIKKIISFILIISFALILTGCKKTVELSFETNGGNAISSVSLEKNSEYTLPIPTRDGFTFIG